MAPSDDSVAEPAKLPTPPWEQGPPTTLVLVRHGVTLHTAERRFSGRQGADPSLSDEGRGQVEATADWLAPLAGVDPILLSSPMQRTRETADILASRIGGGVTYDDGLVEAGFGSWEGLTFSEVMKQDPTGFQAWISDHSLPAGGEGDSLTTVDTRIAETRDRLLSAYQGRTVVAATHLTPIKLFTRQVLDLPFDSLIRTEISPASITVLVWYPDGRGAVRLLNGHPTGDHLAAGLIR